MRVRRSTVVIILVCISIVLDCALILYVNSKSVTNPKAFNKNYKEDIIGTITQLK